MLFSEYPTYYEDAAHIVRFLTDSGGKLNPHCDMHIKLCLVANHLDLVRFVDVSHAEEGARLIQLVYGYDLPEPKRRRLNAIAGTLIGNFLVKNRRPRNSER